MRSALPIFVIGLGSAFGVLADPGREKPQKVSLCDLASHASDYDGRRVTVDARLAVSSYTLEDVKCPEAHIRLNLMRSPPPEVCERAGRHLSPLGCPGETRAFVDGSFTGTFQISNDGSGVRLDVESVMSFYSDERPAY